ncbi:hypothetical protein [Aestuariispira ectoiniformans]|uniref:hypothetical protein n=1 Tax=Aestuariispira ectoiniformans TaxID=2775080 RepID=UPI00223B6807|nr:hypothetical protein [Aestuariispira ectoiniformans]
MGGSAKSKKGHLGAWIAVLIGIGALFAIALSTYAVFRPGRVSSKGDGKQEVAELCTAPQKQDHEWRWYTRHYPSPDTQWRIFVVGNTLCFRSGKNWKGFSIDRREVQKYGCFETYAGLFCRRNADPMKHPNAAAYTG